MQNIPKCSQIFPTLDAKHDTCVPCPHRIAISEQHPTRQLSRKHEACVQCPNRASIVNDIYRDTHKTWIYLMLTLIL